MDEIVRKLRDKRHKLLFESVEETSEEFEEEEGLEEDTKNPNLYYMISGRDKKTGKFKGYIFTNEKSMKKFDKSIFSSPPKVNTIHKSNVPNTINNNPEGRYTLVENDETEERGQIAEEGDFDDFKRNVPDTVKEGEDIAPKKKCTCGSTNIVTENGQDICDDCGRQVKDAPIKEATPNDSQKTAALRKAIEWWSVGKYQRAVELYKRYGITDREFARALVGSLRESEEEINLDADDIDEALTMSPATAYIEKDGEESLRVLINDTEYRYRSESMSVNDLLKKFMGIYKHSAGSALQWLKRNSYVYYNGKTKKLAESEQVAFITPEISPAEDVLGKNIIRSVHTPMSTANKPGFDASLSEANDTEKFYTEKELIAHLRSSKESTIYIRTTRVKAGWDDVQFAAQRAGYEVSKVHDKSLLQKLRLPGNFAEFYVFRKR